MKQEILDQAMSQILAQDAPLLDHWDPLFDCAYYQLPPSPPDSTLDHPSPMLKARRDADSACVPTSQLFELPTTPRSPASRASSLAADSQILDSPQGTKRSASPPSSQPPRKRTVGERISSKDFIPPDVSGLSKREARLVKNRAAAFLSRQRKREEFECMEVRVAELEQENARLLALASGSPNQLLSEVEQLKAQLAAAQERERSLSAQLASSPVKVEATEPSFRPQVPIKSASLGLMVLLCALPSLLSMRMQTAQTSFSIPNIFPAASTVMDYPFPDWTQPQMMPLAHQNIRKLEFAGAESVGLDSLGDLDIAFDASPSDDGKIRVRILPSSSATPSLSSSSRSTSPSPSAHWAPSSTPIAEGTDPFLGFGTDGLMDLGYPVSHSDFLPSEYHIPDTMGSTRRVRIALKSMPGDGGEGGEWEVQLC